MPQWTRRRRRLKLSHVDYHGGHPAHPKRARGLVLVVDGRGIEVRRFRKLFVIRWGEVTAVTVEGPEQAEKHLAAPRTLGLALAFGAKPTTGDPYLFVRGPGYDAGFRVPETSAEQLRAQLAPWVAHPAVPVPSDGGGPARRAFSRVRGRL